jgi:hypothetical protein
MEITEVIGGFVDGVGFVVGLAVGSIVGFVVAIGVAGITGVGLTTSGVSEGAGAIAVSKELPKFEPWQADK